MKEGNPSPRRTESLTPSKEIAHIAVPGQDGIFYIGFSNNNIKKVAFKEKLYLSSDVDVTNVVTLDSKGKSFPLHCEVNI